MALCKEQGWSTEQGDKRAKQARQPGGNAAGRVLVLVRKSAGQQVGQSL